MLNTPMDFINLSFAMPLAVLTFFICLAFVIVGSARVKRAWANINTYKMGTNQNVRWYPCPAGVTSGMPVLIGTMAAVAVDAYDSSTGGTDFWFDGSYFLTTIGQSTVSPAANIQINPGDELYAQGTYDPTTGVTYNMTIDVTNGNCPFGNYEGVTPILAGATNTYAPIRLKIGGSPGGYARY